MLYSKPNFDLEIFMILCNDGKCFAYDANFCLAFF